MFQRFHALREEREGGFTLIELLVVVLIIAILAAIAIPVFLRQREKAYVSASQSTLKDAATAQEAYLDTQVQNGATATYASTLDLLEGEGFNATDGVVVSMTIDADQSYCLIATNGSLDTSHLWNVASYSSTTGEPSIDDTCPAAS